MNKRFAEVYKMNEVESPIVGCMAVKHQSFETSELMKGYTVKSFNKNVLVVTGRNGQDEMYKFDGRGWGSVIMSDGKIYYSCSSKAHRRHSHFSFTNVQGIADSYEAEDDRVMNWKKVAL